MRIKLRQIDIIWILRREMAANRLTITEHRAVDDRPAIERIGYGTPHAQVAQGSFRVVEREDDLPLARRCGDAQSGIGA